MPPRALAKTTRERRHEARPPGVATFAATAHQVEHEHSGQVMAAPRETVLAKFKPNTSPSGPARKMLAILMHRAGVLWARGEWPANNVMTFNKSDLRTSRHKGTERLEDVLTEVGGIRLVTPMMMRDGVPGLSYVAVSPVFHIANSDEDGAPVSIELSPMIVDLVKRERVFARLDVPILIGLEGKFAVTLYQIGQLVLNMKNHPWDDISLKDIRQRLGLKKGEYEKTNDVLRLLERSAQEVNQLSPTFDLKIEPLRKNPLAKRGRTAVIFGFKIYALEKTAVASLAAVAELKTPREGRKARRDEMTAKVKKKAGELSKPTSQDSRRLGTARILERVQRDNIARRESEARVEREEAMRRSTYGESTDGDEAAVDAAFRRLAQKQAGRVECDED